MSLPLLGGMCDHHELRLTCIYQAVLSSSEGVQLGAVRSAAGVVGVWTGATHDDGTLGHCSVLRSPFTDNQMN